MHKIILCAIYISRLSTPKIDSASALLINRFQEFLAQTLQLFALGRRQAQGTGQLPGYIRCLAPQRSTGLGEADQPRTLILAAAPALYQALAFQSLQ